MLWIVLTLAAALVFYLSFSCPSTKSGVHTEEKPRGTRVRNILWNFRKKKQYLMNALYISIYNSCYSIYLIILSSWPPWSWPACRARWSASRRTCQSRDSRSCSRDPWKLRSLQKMLVYLVLNDSYSNLIFEQSQSKLPGSVFEWHGLEKKLFSYEKELSWLITKFFFKFSRIKI